MPNLNEFDEFRTVRVFAYGSGLTGFGPRRLRLRRYCRHLCVRLRSRCCIDRWRHRHRVGIDARERTDDHVAPEQTPLQRLQRLALRVARPFVPVRGVGKTVHQHCTEALLGLGH